MRLPNQMGYSRDTGVLMEQLEMLLDDMELPDTICCNCWLPCIGDTIYRFCDSILKAVRRFTVRSLEASWRHTGALGRSHTLTGHSATFYCRFMFLWVKATTTTRDLGPVSINAKTVFLGITSLRLYIRRPWDRLIFIMGISITLRRHLYNTGLLILSS